MKRPIVRYGVQGVVRRDETNRNIVIVIQHYAKDKYSTISCSYSLS